MKFLNFFQKAESKEKPGGFSDFFLHTPDKKKEEVLREAARRANEEQREILTKSHSKARTI